MCSIILYKFIILVIFRWLLLQKKIPVILHSPMSLGRDGMSRDGFCSLRAQGCFDSWRMSQDPQVWIS